MRLIIGLLSACILTACASGEVRENLGLNREAPDEFRVVSRPPLSVPPDFYLRPPEPGAPSFGTPQAEDGGRSIVFQDDGAPVTRILQKPKAKTAVDPVVSSSLTSSGEANLLQRAGAGKADPAIRRKLESASQSEQKDRNDDLTPLDKWLGLKGSDPVVDAREEAKRIRRNIDGGKPVNEGEVKTVDPASQSVIKKVFE